MSKVRKINQAGVKEALTPANDSFSGNQLPSCLFPLPNPDAFNCQRYLPSCAALRCAVLCRGNSIVDRSVSSRLATGVMVGLWRRKESELNKAAAGGEPSPGKKQQQLMGRAQQMEQVLASFQFKEDCIIGWGGSSTVYKAVLGDGTAVALKRLGPLGFDHDRLLPVLARVHHRNLASILGWDLWRKVIVLRYMPNSCLARRLYSRDHALDWDRRHRIALGVARGLEHLHHRCSPGIVHGNLKPSKILLDSDMEPCVTDFGMLSQQARVDTAYAAPEIALAGFGTPSAKQDVFSFGVLLLELLTGQPPMDSSVFEKGLTISAWVDKALTSGSSWQLVLDRKCVAAASEAQLAEMKALLKLGVWCSQKLPAGRPDMSTVLKIIGQIRQPATAVLPRISEQDRTGMVPTANATIRSLMLRRMQSSARVFT